MLLTGMSGTGKSTVLAELARRGHRVVDVDDPGWSEEVDSLDGSGREQLWCEEPMVALLAEDAAGCLFVAGCASNQRRFYDRFDAVVLLSLPAETLLERIATRATNSFGKDPAERERIVNDLREVEPVLRASATVELRSDRPLREIVDAVEALARRAAKSRGECAADAECPS